MGNSHERNTLKPKNWSAIKDPSPCACTSVKDSWHIVHFIAIVDKDCKIIYRSFQMS